MDSEIIRRNKKELGHRKFYDKKHVRHNENGIVENYGNNAKEKENDHKSSKFSINWRNRFTSMVINRTN